MKSVIMIPYSNHRYGGLLPMSTATATDITQHHYSAAWGYACRRARIYVLWSVSIFTYALCTCSKRAIPHSPCSHAIDIRHLLPIYLRIHLNRLSSTWIWSRIDPSIFTAVWVLGSHLIAAITLFSNHYSSTIRPCLLTVLVPRLCCAAKTNTLYG